MTEPATKKRKEGENNETKKVKSGKYYNEEGEVELLSSNGVSFRLHAYQLQASSSVFRDMISGGSNSVIELVDPVLETSEVITALFDVLFDGFNIARNSSRPLLAHSVVRLAEQYDFARLLDVLRLQIRAMLSDDVPSAFIAFLLGACLSDHDTCAKAIGDAGGYQWGGAKTDDETFGSTSPTGQFLDVTTWNVAHCRLAGAEYMWALSRATKGSEANLTQTVSTEDATLIANEFRRLMSLEGAPKCSWDADGRRID